MTKAIVNRLIQAALVAFMVGGAGVSLAYFELAHFQIVMLSVIRRWLLEESSRQVSSLVAASRGVVHV